MFLKLYQQLYQTLSAVIQSDNVKERLSSKFSSKKKIASNSLINSKKKLLLAIVYCWPTVTVVEQLYWW